MMIRNFKFIKLKILKMDKKLIKKIIMINNTHPNKVLFNLKILIVKI